MEGGGLDRFGTSLPRVRLYRSAAATAGASGALTSLAWDATSGLLTKLGYTHSTSSNAEQITVDLPGLHSFRAVVRFDAALLISAVRAEIQVDTGGGFVAIGRAELPAAGTAIVASGVTSLPVHAAAELLGGAIVRVQIAGAGAANAPLVEGDGDTFFEAFMLPSG